MGELKVDKEKMRKAAMNLGDDVEEYKKFGKKPFKEEIAMLKGMNTDFLAHFNTTLKNINDSNAAIIKNFEGMANKSKEIVDKFEDLDEKVAEKIGGK